MSLLPTIGATATMNRGVIECRRDTLFARFDNNLPSPIVKTAFHPSLVATILVASVLTIIENFLVCSFPSSRHELSTYLHRPSFKQASKTPPPSDALLLHIFGDPDDMRVALIEACDNICCGHVIAIVP